MLEEVSWLRSRDQVVQGCRQSGEVSRVLIPPDCRCPLLVFCAPQEVADEYNVDLG